MRKDHINKMMYAFFEILIFVGVGAFFVNFSILSPATLPHFAE
jgi:hypothetical protein